MSLVRKISIGRDYKNDAMHYAVGQEVYGKHIICDIVEKDNKFSGRDISEINDKESKSDDKTGWWS